MKSTQIFVSYCCLIYNNSVADIFPYPKLPFYYLVKNNRNHIPHVMKVPDDISLCPERVACKRRTLCRYMANCPAKVRTHFADILNSQLMSNVYSTSTNDKRRSYPDSLIPPKAWFRLRNCRSNFCCFLHRPFWIP